MCWGAVEGVGERGLVMGGNKRGGGKGVSRGVSRGG